MRGGPEGEVTLPQRAPPDPSPKLTVKKSKVSKIQDDNYCHPFHILIVPYNIFLSESRTRFSLSPDGVCVHWKIGRDNNNSHSDERPGDNYCICLLP